MKTMMMGLGVVLTGLSFTACGSTVGLQKPTRFTVNNVRDVSWNDRCNLQAFFDQAPPKNELVSERSYSVPHGRSTQERGTVTIGVRHPVQQAALRRILRRYYKKVPKSVFVPGFHIEVGYYRYCGRLRMLVGSSIVIRTPTSEHHLAYHPCVGELLLNRDLYAFRARHLLQRLARKQASP